MKARGILIILLFISSASSARKIYTLTKDDFINQFNDSKTLTQVYCQKENGERVWLLCNQNTILTVKLNGNKEEELMLFTIKYKNGIIEAVKYNIWFSTKKISTLKIEDVVAFTIERKFQETERPYFNMDSARNLSRQKNDSIKQEYSKGSEWIIYLSKADQPKDTLRIAENACYHLRFSDNKEAVHGVVQKISMDSIYISNYFNEAMAEANKTAYEIFRYPIKAIEEIRLLKAGGFGFRKIQAKDYSITIQNSVRSGSRCPIWFAIDPVSGKINFYRAWLTASGFAGITETDGKAIWYEGEETGYAR